MTIATASLTTTLSNAYVSSGNTAITSMTLCNSSGSDVIANLYVVQSSFSAGITNIVLSNILLTAGDTYQLYQAAEKLLLGPGDSIQANASANAAVAVVTSYTSI